ncbi:MAG: RtcB family protein [Firmicutes bacterium]|nr:RtcB family protein [Bacillota bacterium]
MELQGKFNTAKVFTDNVDEETISQIINLCNQEFIQGSKIRIMPDTHAGVGCVIGTTMTIKDKIVPNLVGVDIGCGMLTVVLGDIEIDFQKLDDYIRANIPCGFAINKQPQTDYIRQIEKLICFREIPKSAKELNRALGSLGGGNHFIEVNKDKNGAKYLVVHSGSRNLGHQVATYYQKKAIAYHSGENDEYEAEKQALIKSYKAQGKRKLIQKALIELKQKHRTECKIPKDLAYLEGRLMENYLHDMRIVQKYAEINREVMARKIVCNVFQLDYESLEKFQTIHNYIDTEQMILRKGAISAQLGERVLIPINMRDGSILAVGKGNPDWNFSAPHGAGRLMSRSQAKEQLSLADFQTTMQNVWSSSVKKSTLDEAPMAYKPLDEIIKNIQDAVEIIDIIKPLYNFKAS